MTSYTNTTKHPLDFVVGSKSGDVQFASFKPGETKDAELNTDDPSVKGALVTGARVAADAAARRAARKVVQTEVPPAS